MKKQRLVSEKFVHAIDLGEDHDGNPVLLLSRSRRQAEELLDQLKVIGGVVLGDCYIGTVEDTNGLCIAATPNAITKLR